LLFSNGGGGSIQNNFIIHDAESGATEATDIVPTKIFVSHDEAMDQLSIVEEVAERRQVECGV
jgi:hypothetical protein